jgi:hypothetical protein
MYRQTFFSPLGRVGAALGLPWPNRSQPLGTGAHDPHKSALRIALKDSSLVGYPCDASDAIWDQLRVRDSLTLRRERGNAHDAKAVVVEWEGAKLGYLRMDENIAIPGPIDADENVKAGIANVTKTTKPSGRVLLWMQ